MVKRSVTASSSTIPYLDFPSVRYLHPAATSLQCSTCFCIQQYLISPATVMRHAQCWILLIDLNVNDSTRLCAILSVIKMFFRARLDKHIIYWLVTMD